jgi:hypothetical protein
MYMYTLVAPHPRTFTQGANATPLAAVLPFQFRALTQPRSPGAKGITLNDLTG